MRSRRNLCWRSEWRWSGSRPWLRHVIVFLRVTCHGLMKMELGLAMANLEGSTFVRRRYLLCVGRGVTRLCLFPKFTLASTVETRCKQIIFRTCLPDLILGLKLPSCRQNLTHSAQKNGARKLPRRYIRPSLHEA